MFHDAIIFKVEVNVSATFFNKNPE